MARSPPSPEDVLNRLPPLVMGGAGFSYQLHPDPASLPVLSIITKAFEMGLRTIDTSPYYEPSEELLGAALSHPDLAARYSRGEYVLMTKVGRIGERQFDYSPDWIRKSVARSLQRFSTTYLDVVFCHDVEFVSTADAVEAVGTLFDIAKTGAIKCIGISGYDIEALTAVAVQVRSKYGRTVDVVQNWAQLTLQNTKLEQRGFAEFRQAGVKAVCSSSPLAVGLLRNGGVPLGALGDWHPAPQGLRAASRQAAEWVELQGETLASLALRFAIWRAQENSSSGFTVTTITGIGSMSDLEQNVLTARQLFKPSTGVVDESGDFDQEAVERDQPLYEGVRSILGHWLDYDFSDPSPKGIGESRPEDNSNSSEGSSGADSELVSRL